MYEVENKTKIVNWVHSYILIPGLLSRFAVYFIQPGSKEAGFLVVSALGRPSVKQKCTESGREVLRHRIRQEYYVTDAEY